MFPDHNERVVKNRFEKITTPDSRDVEVMFDKRKGNFEVESDVVETTIEIFGSAYDYLHDILGKENLSNQWGLVFGHSFVGDGTLIEVDTEEMSRWKKDSTLTKYDRDLDMALVIHEMTHSFEEEENLSMLIEIVFMTEKGQKHRVRDIKQMLINNQLPPQHVKGIKDIAGWLHEENPIDMLDKIDSGAMTTDVLKSVFLDKVKSIMAEND